MTHQVKLELYSTVEPLFVHFPRTEAWVEFAVRLKIRERGSRRIHLKAYAVWSGGPAREGSPVGLAGDFETLCEAFTYIASNVHKGGGHLVHMSNAKIAQLKEQYGYPEGRAAWPPTA